MRMSRVMMWVLALVCVVNSVRAQWLVYDFKTSLKRLNAESVKVSYSLNEYDQTTNILKADLDTYNVVGDTCTGYLIIPANLDYNSTPIKHAHEVVAGLDLRRANDANKFVWRFNPEFSAKLFSKTVGVRNIGSDRLLTGPTSLKSLTQAGVQFDFCFENLVPPRPFGKTGILYQYGFLGFGSVDGHLWYNGLGAVSLYKLGDLGLSSHGTPTCFVLTNITGTMGGSTAWAGLSVDVPIWDFYESLIDDITTKSGCAEVATHGTWSMSFNKKMTLTMNGCSDITSVILAKLNGSRLVTPNE